MQIGVVRPARTHCQSENLLLMSFRPVGSTHTARHQESVEGDQAAERPLLGLLAPCITCMAAKRSPPLTG